MTTMAKRVRQTKAASEKEHLLAVPLSGAAKLVGVSERRLVNWAEIGLVEPSVVRRISQRNTVRLYGFLDLLSLMVVRELLKQRMSTPQIKRVVAHLRDSGYERPLTELKFATEGHEIFFQHPNGTWEGDRRHNQIVLHQVLDLQVLKAEIWRSVEEPRSRSVAGRIEQRRRVQGHKPVFAGTRIPVASVVSYLERGSTTEEILEAFPDLRAEDVRVARQEARLVSA
jgi:uncharacterized protein (DUF433 family)